MSNYDIEMWRYSKELKFQSNNPLLGHEHIKSSEAVLQSVNIRTNNYGLRGENIEPADLPLRRILFLGSSVTLGWGVSEEDTMTFRLDKALGDSVKVLNAGIGNYNTERYVENFLENLTELSPTDIVIHYFVNDAEELPLGGGNWALKNSQLAVTFWIVANRLIQSTGGNNLVDHYQDVYLPASPGFQKMTAALDKIKVYAEINHINIVFAMTPDVHNLVDYKFRFIHDIMAKEAINRNFTYIDMLPAFDGLSNPQSIWAMPGDPHPNALGHQLMADFLLPALAN